MSVGGGRSLRRQIEAALSGAGDPLGDEGLGLPDGPAPHETAIRRDAAARRDASNSVPASGAAGTSPRARRLPDLHVLPPLLHATGSFGALWQRLGSEDAPLPRTGAARVGGRAPPSNGSARGLGLRSARGQDLPSRGDCHGRRCGGSPASLLGCPRRRDRRSSGRGTPGLAWRCRCRGRPGATDRARLRAERDGSR